MTLRRLAAPPTTVKEERHGRGSHDPGYQRDRKIRNPLGVIGLGIITLGIYSCFWWYFINREMNDLGETYRDEDLKNSPGLAVLATTLGVLIIVPPFVTMWRTCKRIERSQERVIGSNNFSPLLAFLLVFIPIVSLVSIYLMQSNLNQVWERQ
ncbi:MAG: DUF4234 domain-containing protein [Solirubrobacteraceae bacterium]